jgi:hypothetical protein
MIWMIDANSKGHLPMKIAAGLAVSAVLLLGTVAAPAEAAGSHGGGGHGGGGHGGGGRGHGGGGYRGGGGGWNRGYYAPPVVYGSPYGSPYYGYGSPYYYPPPVVYGPGMGLNIRIR